MSFWNRGNRRPVQYCTHTWRVLFAHFVDANHEPDFGVTAFLRNCGQKPVLGAASSPSLRQNGQPIDGGAGPAVRKGSHGFGKFPKRDEAPASTARESGPQPTRGKPRRVRMGRLLTMTTDNHSRAEISSVESEFAACPCRRMRELLDVAQDCHGPTDPLGPGFARDRLERPVSPQPPLHVQEPRWPTGSGSCPMPGL